MVTNRDGLGSVLLAARVLAAIAAEPSALMTSAHLAEALGAHPVVIRRLLGRLRSDGLVEGRSGPGGGWALARDPDKLGLGLVRRALREAAPAAADDLLARTIRSAEEAFERELDRVTIGDLRRDLSQTNL